MTTLTEADVEQAALFWLANLGWRGSAISYRGGAEVKPMNWRDYISSDPMVCHGKACITGTRVMVTIILDSLADGLSVEDVKHSYPSVSREAVQACLHYAAELARERIAPPAQ